ncbi:hypothetical protein [Salarchaeum sp. JOR-1]|uniref:hypothetical protein n=1 Tax=Salarchaeum sp. JOR-1 TaxID=2599399 RepID=UPI0011987FCB|nr:hypothetical protein [Salarchaeum sp. JOR-1]QDX40365.1 hypothetical protein FQU85_05430 [Salarchaeum sp. JOR-1]
MSALDALARALIAVSLVVLVAASLVGIYVGTRYRDTLHYRDGVEAIGYGILLFTASAVLQTLHFWAGVGTDILLAASYLVHGFAALAFAVGAWYLVRDLIVANRDEPFTALDEGTDE